MLMRVDNLKKSYDNKKILKDISFQIEEGEMIALLGPNGSGKTTLFRCLSSLAAIDDGKIEIDREKINNNRITYVFDQPTLYETLTGEEHVRFVMDLNKIRKTDDETNHIFEKFNVSKYKNKKISEYSLGMKKKIQLICAMITEPKLLLLDEYISGLDPVSLKDIVNILGEYVSEGNTVILSTHILDIAQRVCNKVMFIHDGRIVRGVSDINVIKGEYDSLEEFYFKMAQ